MYKLSDFKDWRDMVVVIKVDGNSFYAFPIERYSNGILFQTEAGVRYFFTDFELEHPEITGIEIQKGNIYNIKNWI